MFMIRLLWIALVLFLPLLVNAKALPADDSNDKKRVDALINSTEILVSERVRENYVFYGLASYYNNVNYFIVESDDLHRIDKGEVVELSQAQWLAVVGRLNVLLIQAAGLSLHLDEATLVFDNPEILSQSDAVVKMVAKPALSSIAPELDQIRYAHLWEPLAWLAKLVETSLVAIQAHLVSNWGLAIVVFSILLKLLLLPVGVMTVRFQRRVSQVQAALAPQLAEIKANYDGEEAHNRLMAAHKELGVSPFYTLKPMLGSLIQVPILVAVFNALGEMPQLSGQSFLWIESLAYPDAIGHLPLSIPMFGDTISLLPFIMTVVTLYSTVIFQNRHAPETEMKRQKRNLYLMAAAFFILFYPFPAAMVLYWVLANILQTIQQQIVKI
ncbi:MAG: membrane protein insertase YidC [Candidatus Polarisedimenticolaceae bacterium]|nr:membrane protein insertase YidC [Candidatus Polarisedimenticolaceae bacterium]